MHVYKNISTKIIYDHIQLIDHMNTFSEHDESFKC